MNNCNYYAKSCASVITAGIVIIDRTVLSDTISTESAVSPPPNFEENIVVTAATGALNDIITETSSVPRTPKIYKAPRDTSG